MISITFKEYTQTLDLHRGQVVGLFGKNGAGKTTLMKQIMGMPTYAKELEKHIVDGKPFSYECFNKMVYVTDGEYLYDDMTALEHKKFFASFYKGFNGERFDKLMELFELKIDNPVKNYSKGQRSKLELALGFSKGAKYILMDEPFLGNDPFMRNDFLKIMAGLLDEDSILVIATHYLEEIESFIDRAVFMDYHKIVKDMSMDEILENGSNLMSTAKEIFGVDDNRVLELFKEE